MRNNMPVLPNLHSDCRWQHIFPPEFPLSQVFGSHLLSQFSTLVGGSFYHSNNLYSSGSLALLGAVNYFSKFAGTLFIRLHSGLKSSILHELCDNSYGSKYSNIQSCSEIELHGRNILELQFGFGSNAEPSIPVTFGKFVNRIRKQLLKDVDVNWVFPLLSLAESSGPASEILSSEILSNLIPAENYNERTNAPINQSMIEIDCRGCSSVAISKNIWGRDAVEPRTGVMFPTSMGRPLGGNNDMNSSTEVLVGIGSKSMQIVRIKSLKLYAFGLYVNPDSIREKLGSKYASTPISDLENCSNFFEDLLREDIYMSVRLVINCNGLKINTVRDAFEKSLRGRLQKMNPNTDYNCLSAFRAHFMKDIPLPLGTTIDFRQTADGQLITEIGGKQIGAVQNKDLCRAFFDMYIGDVPVSVEAKQEIMHNVAHIIRVS